MGGIGFSQYSKMFEFYAAADVNQTFEGDNKILITQTSKYLLKNVFAIMQGKNKKKTRRTYLEYMEEHFKNKDYVKTFSSDFRDLKNLLAILRSNASMVNIIFLIGVVGI